MVAHFVLLLDIVIFHFRRGLVTVLLVALLSCIGIQKPFLQ
jgi:hypothetical protein